MEGPQKPMEIQVTFPEHLKGGVYSNSMTVTHTREEFVLDFLMVTLLPPAPSPRGSSSPPATPNGSSQRSRKTSGSTRGRTGRS